jgi:SAM-dependent methyltransferase
VADIGGGTGNCSIALRAQGWTPTVIDRSAEMLLAAESKDLRTLRADAQALPLADESFDGAMLISMLHHVEDQAQALSEAARILRPGGRLAVMAFTREDVSDLWCFDYFPSAWPWMRDTHPPLQHLLELLAGSHRLPVVYEDLKDASMAALLGHPELLLKEQWRENTSFFERLRRDHSQELDEGLARLELELQAGCAPREPGGASMICWRKPAGYQR